MTDSTQKKDATRQTVDVPPDCMAYFDGIKRQRKIRSFGAYVVGLIRGEMAEARTSPDVVSIREAAQATPPAVQYPHGDEILAAMGNLCANFPPFQEFLASQLKVPDAWLDALKPIEEKRKAK